MNWQFRRIDHNDSHKPVSILSPGTLKSKAWQGRSRTVRRRNVSAMMVANFCTKNVFSKYFNG